MRAFGPGEELPEPTKTRTDGVRVLQLPSLGALGYLQPLEATDTSKTLLKTEAEQQESKKTKAGATSALRNSFKKLKGSLKLLKRSKQKGGPPSGFAQGHEAGGNAEPPIEVCFGARG